MTRLESIARNASNSSINGPPFTPITHTYRTTSRCAPIGCPISCFSRFFSSSVCRRSIPMLKICKGDARIAWRLVGIGQPALPNTLAPSPRPTNVRFFTGRERVQGFVGRWSEYRARRSERVGEGSFVGEGWRRMAPRPSLGGSSVVAAGNFGLGGGSAVRQIGGMRSYSATAAAVKENEVHDGEVDEYQHVRGEASDQPEQRTGLEGSEAADRIPAGITEDAANNSEPAGGAPSGPDADPSPTPDPVPSDSGPPSAAPTTLTYPQFTSLLSTSLSTRSSRRRWLTRDPAHFQLVLHNISHFGPNIMRDETSAGKGMRRQVRRWLGRVGGRIVKEVGQDGKVGRKAEREGFERALERMDEDSVDEGKADTGGTSDMQVHADFGKVMKSLIAELIEFNLDWVTVNVLKHYDARGELPALKLGMELRRAREMGKWDVSTAILEHIRRRGSDDSSTQLPLYLHSLNESGQFQRVLAKAGVPAEIEDMHILAEVMRARLSLRHVVPAMEIRARFWQSGWRQDQQVSRAYVEALAKGISQAGHIPELEERILTEEVQVVEMEERVVLLDAMAEARIRAKLSAAMLLPYYFSTSGQVGASLLLRLPESASALRWASLSRDVVPDYPTLQSLWGMYIAKQREGRIPASMLESYILAGKNVGNLDGIYRVIKEVVQRQAGMPPEAWRFDLDRTTFRPFLAVYTRERGEDAAREVLDLMRVANVKPEMEEWNAIWRGLLRYNRLPLRSRNRKSALTRKGRMVAPLSDDGVKKKGVPVFQDMLAAELTAFFVPTEMGESKPIRSRINHAAGRRITYALKQDWTPMAERRKRAQSLTSWRSWLMAERKTTTPHEAYTHMVAEKIPADAFRFEEIMAAFLGLRRQRHALGAFKLARALGIVPSHYMWILLMWGLAAPTQQETRRSVILGLKGEGVPLRISAVTEAIVALLRGGRVADGVALVDLVCSLTPIQSLDIQFITIALRAKARVGHLGEVNRFLEACNASLTYDRQFRDVAERIKDFFDIYPRGSSVPSKQKLDRLVGIIQPLVTSQQETVNVVKRAFKNLYEEHIQGSHDKAVRARNMAQPDEAEPGTKYPPTSAELPAPTSTRTQA